MTGVLVLAGLVSATGGWAQTFEDVKEEMSASPMSQLPARLSLSMWVPMLFSGTTGMPLTDLCVSEGSVRPKDPSKASMNFGKVRAGNQYSVNVFGNFVSSTGENKFGAERTVELPACKQ
jgi:hypothetical protein